MFFAAESSAVALLHSAAKNTCYEVTKFSSVRSIIAHSDYNPSTMVPYRGEALTEARTSTASRFIFASFNMTTAARMLRKFSEVGKSATFHMAG